VTLPSEVSSNRPELSVVVPSVNGFSDLKDCLSALDRERERVALEVLVVERCGEPVRAQVRQHFPAVRVMPVDTSTTIPQMRALAFQEATAPAVAVIEDHVLVPAGWARQMLDALGDGQRVVAGSIENAATSGLMDWAAFLCEYSHCLTPLPAGPVDWLTGNNVVYPKALLNRYWGAASAGRWENHLHETMRQDGVPLVCHPEIAADHKKHYTFTEYLSQRYLYARSYAGARVAGRPVWQRIAFGLGAFLLPPVLFGRTVSRIFRKGRHRGLLLKSLPLIAVFVLAWAWGEVVGSWLGPGDSLAKVC
jgi:hypothetical protein